MRKRNMNKKKDEQVIPKFKTSDKVITSVWIILIIFVVSYIIYNSSFNCVGNAQDNPDLLYQRTYYLENSNETNIIYLSDYYVGRAFFYTCSVRDLNQEREQRKQYQAMLEKQRLEYQQRLACFNTGRFENYTYDLVKDYNLSCSRIAYMNDHLLLSSTKMKSGTIEGYYSGFLSHGHVSGEFYDWVYSQVMSLNKLPKYTSVHYDCKNTTQDVNGADTKIIKYYTPEDFVNYYVQRCIE